MPTSKLNTEEKAFLAGCIKSMMLADGSINDNDLADLDKLIAEMPFPDFDEALTLFEESIKDSETFWETAERMNNEYAKDTILTILDELSLQDGFASRNELGLLTQLEELWQ